MTEIRVAPELWSTSILPQGILQQWRRPPGHWRRSIDRWSRSQRWRDVDGRRRVHGGRRSGRRSFGRSSHGQWRR